MDEKPSPVTLSELEREFRQTISEMTLLAWGKTASYGERTTSGESSFFEPPGEKTPPQDEYVIRWRQAEKERRSPLMLKIWEEAWEDLRERTTRKVTEVVEESTQERNARLLRDGRGAGTKECEYHFKMNGKEIRAIRVQANCNPENGLPLHDAAKPGPVDNREWAVELATKGFSERMIEVVTGVPKTTVRRIVEKSALAS